MTEWEKVIDPHPEGSLGISTGEESLFDIQEFRNGEWVTIGHAESYLEAEVIYNRAKHRIVKGKGKENGNKC